MAPAVTNSLTGRLIELARDAAVLALGIASLGKSESEYPAITPSWRPFGSSPWSRDNSARRDPKRPHLPNSAIIAFQLLDAVLGSKMTGEAPQGCVIEQVWFAGAHADVGGGYITRKLADIPLLWMAKKAEASGLHLDWTCLPDEKNLYARAPIHDSSSGLFTLDRVRSTWRQIAGKSFNVGLLERIYAPHDAQGNLLPTINQAIHSSIITRLGQLADTCASDETGSCEQVVYQPLNLTPFFVGSTGALMPGVPVAGENA